MHFAELRGGGHRRERRVLDMVAVMLDQDQNAHFAIPKPCSSLDQLVDAADLDPGLALGRLGHLQRLQPPRDVDAVIARRLGRERLRLGLHDVGQRGIARLVQAQVGGDYRRQVELHRLEPAIDLARDGRAVGHLDLRRERALRPAEQRREHLPGRIIVVVDRLLAEDDQLRLLLLGDLGEDLGDGERLDLLVGLDEDRAVGAHRQRGAQASPAPWPGRSTPRRSRSRRPFP